MSTNHINVSLKQQTPIPLNVEFDCKGGEILVILGPSGSGKSTILRSVAGLYLPQQGTISANGQEWFDSASKRRLTIQERRCGIVFQHYALFPHLSAMKNICIALSHLTPGQRPKKAMELLDLVNMQGLEDRLPHQLSGGQQQRVALARALARDPQVLLLDEPFSAVDQQTRRKLVRELIQLRSQLEIPIIHVTHDLNEARRIADRICIIHHGNTLQIDKPQLIMSKPLNKNVAYLVGHYNVFEARVEKHDASQNKTWVKWLDYQLETCHRPDLNIGEEIDWVIPAENLILHRRDRPSKGERENPVNGQIVEFIPMGENAAVSIQVDQADIFLSMSVPTHVAQRNELAMGASITVSLLSEGIHLMPR